MAVDDVEGRLHQELDPKPNSFYVMDKDGSVAFRSLWSNDAGALRKGLRAVTGEAPKTGQVQSHMVPMLSGVGEMYEVLEQSGPTAKRDVLRQAPPMYLMARLANAFRPLPPLARGVAAVVTVGFVGTALGAGLRAWWRRRHASEGGRR